MPRYDDYDAFYKMKQAAVLAQLNPARRTLPFASVEDGGYLRVRNGGNIVVEPGGYVDASKGTIDFADSTIEGSWLDYVFAYQNISFHGTGSMTNIALWPETVMKWNLSIPTWAARGVASVTMSGTSTERGLASLAYGYISDADFSNDTAEQVTVKFGNESLWSFSSSAAFGLDPSVSAGLAVRFNNSDYQDDDPNDPYKTLDRIARIEAWVQGSIIWFGGDLS